MNRPPKLDQNLTIGRSVFMAKYSFEFKMEVVQAYLNAEGGYRYLASKYNIPAKRRIEEWVHAYREFGEEGLMRSRQNKNILSI